MSVAVNWGRGGDGRGGWEGEMGEGAWEVRTATVDVGRLYRRRQWLLGHGCGDGGETSRVAIWKGVFVVCRKDASRVGDGSSKLQTDNLTAVWTAGFDWRLVLGFSSQDHAKKYLSGGLSVPYR